jgi:hypothetical protein
MSMGLPESPVPINLTREATSHPAEPSVPGTFHGSLVLRSKGLLESSDPGPGPGAVAHTVMNMRKTVQVFAEVFSTELTRLQKRIIRLLGIPKAYSA